MSKRPPLDNLGDKKKSFKIKWVKIHSYFIKTNKKSNDYAFVSIYFSQRFD